LFGGGGGGGRIALYSPMNTFTGVVTVLGGVGAFSGADGTIFSSSNLFGLEVVSQTPAGLVTNPVAQIALDFNQPLSPSNISASNVPLYTPTGLLDASSVTVSVVGLSTLRVAFPMQIADGDYRVEVGDAVRDLFGQALSQVYTGMFSLTPLIVGTVADTNGAGVSGVALQASGGATATTDGSGFYFLSVTNGWSGTVVPSLAGYLPVPASRNYTNLSGSIRSQDYLAVFYVDPALAAQRSGANVSLGWNAQSNLTYQIYSSTNLLDWTPVDGAITGTNGAVQVLIPIGNEPEKFFRLDTHN
jgi:hypothetical protein